MNFFKALLGAVDTSGSFLQQDSAGENLKQTSKNLLATFIDVMQIVMPIVFGVVLALGVFFSLKLGINYAKQETTEKREEAKKRLVGAVVGFGIGIVAAVVCWILLGSDIAYDIFSINKNA